jgi:hypothetical protein
VFLPHNASPTCHFPAFIIRSPWSLQKQWLMISLYYTLHLPDLMPHLFLPFFIYAEMSHPPHWEGQGYLLQV